jgi:hypothetical protein
LKFGPGVIIQPNPRRLVIPAEVLYCIDHGEWSDKIIDSLEEQPFLKVDELSAENLVPGTHILQVRYQEEGKPYFGIEQIHYEVNGAPSIRVSDTSPLSLIRESMSQVQLPISVEDLNGDEVCVFYRFAEEEPWSEATKTDGVYFLPAGSFTGRFQKGSSGAVELLGWDGFETTDELVKIPFLMLEGDNDDDAEPEGRVDGNSGLFEILSPTAFAGIVVGGVGVVALAVGVGIFIARRKKTETTTTGLIEEE